VAHGAVLRKNFFSAEQLIGIARDYRSAGLPPDETALMAYAWKVAEDATRTGPADIQSLRDHGFSDEDILNITLTAAARCAFSKTLDALGAQPDETYRSLEPELLEALCAGRPFPPVSKE
jgi:alkylhydroperoxidase family enzyme